jgi:4-hydroxy-2-oxoglutarate aldolase
MAEIYTGVFAALTTPFEGDAVSEEKFCENIKKYNSFSLSGYVVAGTSGEATYLTDNESEKLVQAAKSAASPDKKILVGTARESTTATVAFTNRIAAMGADAALIRTPFYFRSQMTHKALQNYYMTVADQVKIPVIAYHIPQITSLSFNSRLLVELSAHPNIVGVKDSSGNLAFLGEVIRDLPPDFCYLLGAGSVFLPGLLIGASGGILRLADIVPGQCTEIYALFMEKKWEEALKLQAALIPLNNAIIQIYGISGAKYALDLLGYQGGLPRPPLLALEEKGKRDIENILKKLDLNNLG